jgi:hypothetical protein
MMKTALIARASLIGAVCVALAGPAQGDVISDWNAEAEAIQLEKNAPAPPSARVLAIMHIAMFEAINAIDRRYTPYRLNLAAERSFSREAAGASAAHGVLVTFYPDQQARLDAALRASLAAVEDGNAKVSGAALGRQAAAEMISLRKNDNSDVTETYRPHAAVGTYVPTVIPVFSSLGAMTPWVMTSATQFRPPPPPALDSETWTNDVNEVRELGARNSTRRTAEQTNIARFWFLSGPPSWNSVVRQAVTNRKLALVDSARVFALTAMAGNDANIAVFDAKYTYNLWRPVTAIRNADLTGNKATPRDASWLPLGDAPMHPEYPCAHCIASGAVATVLQNVLGDDTEISMTSPAAPGVVRKWTRFREYNDEVSLARVYAGFHYRFSTRVGQEMGRKIGELAVATQLRGVVASADPPR